MDAKVEKAYGGKEKIAWFEAFAGQARINKMPLIMQNTMSEMTQMITGMQKMATGHNGGGKGRERKESNSEQVEE